MIFHVLASGNAEHSTWIIYWMAHLAQFPHENPGAALVFRGQEGTGKGTLGRALMRMMRPHATQITHTKHRTGAFNSHMRDMLSGFAAEVFFAGDRADEGALKGLITEGYRINEAKGKDATLGRNRIHLLMVSNNAWVVPASAEARRFAAFDVSPVLRRDHAYFGAILDEMDVDGDAAGIAAMLFDLRRIPIDMEQFRKMPETQALHAQRMASLRGPSAWLLDVLIRGHVGDSPFQTWEEHYSTDELFESYQFWSRAAKEGFLTGRNDFGKFLSTMFPTFRPRVSDGGTTTLRPGYQLGKLVHARAVFATTHGIGSPWPDDQPDDTSS